MLKIDSDKIINILNNLNKLNILVIGDVMIDKYVWGKVERISPEAPVPIVLIKNTEYRLGGAANVALNIKTLGANPFLFSVIGNDNTANILKNILAENNINNSFLIQSNNRITTLKTRIIGNNFQMLRVDEEIDDNLTNDEENLLLYKIRSFIETNNINCILFEDYDKGIISNFLISEIIKIANKYSIHTAVDPKYKNFNYYKNISLFKPNLKEIKEGLKLDFQDISNDTLNKISQIIHNEFNIDTLLLTLSEKGIYYSNKKNNCSNTIPAILRNIADVSGAGDTVIATASICLSAGLSPYEIAYISNIAGGIVCEKIGTTSINKTELIQNIKQINTM